MFFIEVGNNQPMRFKRVFLNIVGDHALSKILFALTNQTRQLPLPYIKYAPTIFTSEPQCTGLDMMLSKIKTKVSLEIISSGYLHICLHNYS